MVPRVTTLSGCRPDAIGTQPLAPEGLEAERFYEPTAHGFEDELRRRLEEIRRRLSQG